MRVQLVEHDEGELVRIGNRPRDGVVCQQLQPGKPALHGEHSSCVVVAPGRVLQVDLARDVGDRIVRSRLRKVDAIGIEAAVEAALVGGQVAFVHAKVEIASLREPAGTRVDPIQTKGHARKRAILDLIGAAHIELVGTRYLHVRGVDETDRETEWDCGGVEDRWLTRRSRARDRGIKETRKRPGHEHKVERRVAVDLRHFEVREQRAG